VTTQKILRVGSTMFKHAKDYTKYCDVCQRVGKSSHKDDFPLHLVRALQDFEKWEVDFIGHINPPAKHSKARYIIIAIDYLTQWDEAEHVRDCSIDTETKFIFENIITQFGRSLTNDQGAHFISETISTLTREFLIHHHKRSPYHLQVDGTMEEFNTILEKGLTKVCCANQDDEDGRVPTVLWVYKFTTNKLHRYSPFQLVYGKEEIIPTEFITPILYIVHVTHMTDEQINCRAIGTDEAKFLAYFHQAMEKAR
jgi:hypothetical protein